MTDLKARLSAGWKAARQAWGPYTRQTAREVNDDYYTGDLGRNAAFFTSVAVVAVFLLMAVTVAATVTFSADGWPGLIGRWLADQCLAYGACDLSITLPALATVIIILISFLVLMGMAMERSIAALDQRDDDLFTAVNDIVDQNARMHEQNQTLMAMVFMLADTDVRDKIAELFADTLDDEESEVLNKLIEENEAEQAEALATMAAAEPAQEDDDVIHQPF